MAFIPKEFPGTTGIGKLPLRETFQYFPGHIIKTIHHSSSHPALCMAPGRGTNYMTGTYKWEWIARSCFHGSKPISGWVCAAAVRLKGSTKEEAQQTQGKQAAPPSIAHGTQEDGRITAARVYNAGSHSGMLRGCTCSCCKAPSIFFQVFGGADELGDLRFDWRALAGLVFVSKF